MDQSTVTLPTPDYEAEDVLLVREPERLRALGGPERQRIVELLRDRAYSTTELARALGRPKGTIAYHVKVLQQAGLIRVVRTRKVRAVTERSYGRVARLFVLKGSEDDAPLLEARLLPRDAQRLEARLARLVAEFRKSDTPGGVPFALAARLERR